MCLGEEFHNLAFRNLMRDIWLTVISGQIYFFKTDFKSTASCKVFFLFQEWNNSVAPTTSSETGADSMAASKVNRSPITRAIGSVFAPEDSSSKGTPESRQNFEAKTLRETPESVKAYLQLKDMPGPWPSVPFIGTSWQYFPGGRYSLANIYDAYEDKYRRYGPILKEEFQWGVPSVHLFNPDDFEKVFRNQGRYPIRPISEFLVHYRRNHPEKYDSAGLANTLGKEWERLRQIVAPVLLKPKAIQFLNSSMNEVGEDFVQLLRATRDPDTFTIENIQDMTYRLALEGVYMMSLDARLGCLDPDLQENAAAHDMILSVKLLFESFHELFYGLPLWKYFETASYKKLDRAESLMYDATNKQIQEAVQKLRDSNADEEEGVLRTLIQKNELNDKELIVTVIDLISGGIFTIANSFSFLVYHISKNPDVQERLYQELNAVMTDSEITSERMAKMPYLKACVKEAFRLTPTVPCINRTLTQDTVLSGYNIPAGTQVFCNFTVPCMQEDKFPEPHRFYPDRWLQKSLRPQNSFTLLPFGFGQRMCVGKRFAEMEMHSALAKLVYNFKLEHIGPELEVKSAFIIVPANPISVVLRDR